VNLKEFSSKYVNKVKEKVEKSVEELESELKEENIEELDNVKSMYNQYSGMSQGELEQELFHMIEQQKKDGTFDKTQLQNTYQMLLPMLNEEQKQKLEHYMKMIL
jgi:hypothetical protein